MSKFSFNPGLKFPQRYYYLRETSKNNFSLVEVGPLGTERTWSTNLKFYSKTLEALNSEIKKFQEIVRTSHSKEVRHDEIINYLKSFEESNKEDSELELNEDTALPDVVGKKASDCHGEEGIIRAISFVKNYETILKYDTAMTFVGDLKEYGYKDEDIIVAFETPSISKKGKPSTGLYLLGEAGVTLLEEDKYFVVRVFEGGEEGVKQNAGGDLKSSEWLAKKILHTSVEDAPYLESEGFESKIISIRVKKKDSKGKETIVSEYFIKDGIVE